MDNKVEEFLEKNNMTYLFLLLTNLEVERLSNLPYTLKRSFKKKITEMALEHVAANEIPDYAVNNSEEDIFKEEDEQ